MKIEITRLTDDCGNYAGWYAKGNYDLETMIREINAFEEYDDPSDTCMYISDVHRDTLILHHGYARNVPVAPWEKESVGYSFRLMESSKGRGAFEVTCVYFE